MSKKRIINLVEGILQAMLLLALFIVPYVLVQIEKSAYWTRNYDIAEGTYTLWGFSIAAPNIFSYILIGLMLINLIICFISVFSKSITRDGIIHTAITIIIFLSGPLVLFSRGEFGYDLSILPIFQIIFMVLSAATMILSFVKRSSLIAPKKELKQTISIQEASNADELKKFKDLLDNGIITQEEFDEKKKQLLGL